MLRSLAERFTFALRPAHRTLTAAAENPSVKGRLLSAVVGSLLTALLLSPGVLGAGPYEALRPLFGAGFIRAEIVTRGGGTLHDYRVDRGRIRQVRPGAVTLRELDGTMVTIPVAAGAQIKVDGHPADYAELRRGMQAITVRDGDAPALRVVATER
jgi:hypothetical protein